MVDATDIGERIETRKDLGPEKSEPAVYAYWMGQEKIAEREERRWVKQAREIVKRYRDERPESMRDTHRMNILWSNVETLKPTLYARTPKPDVQRTFRDDDPVGLFASELLQRCLEYSCDAHEHHFDAVMKAVVEDRLLPGRAVARVLYVPHYGDPIEDAAGVGREADDTYDAEDAADVVVSSQGDDDNEAESARDVDDTGDAEPDREVVYEETVAVYVFWEDYREGPARQWSEVPWNRFKSYLSRDQLVARFGKKKGNLVTLDYEPKGSPGVSESAKTEIPPDMFKKAAVHEYWDRQKKQVVWIAPGTPDVVLDTVDDPLRLPGFFPNPDPILANATNDKRIPVPDFIQYQDQARELDRLTSRIDKLQGALKVMGLYPGEEKQALQQLIDEGTENKMIPVHDWQRLVDKGGIQGIIQWMPIQQIAETLIQLYNARDRTKQILYELTGMSDILRGQTSPVETLGAQDLKARFASRRISPKQWEVANFACNLIKLKGAVIAEHFSAKTISMITGYPQSQIKPVPPLPPQPAQFIPAPPQAAGNPVPGSGGPAPGPAGNAVAPPTPGVSAGAPGGQPGTSLVPVQQPMMPNPQFAQWQLAVQQVKALMAANQAAQKKFDDAVALIKSDGVHGFRIDIEADSTIAPDEEAQQGQAIAFIKEFVPFVEQIIPMCMGNPAFCDFAEKLVLFSMRPFKVARTLEEATTKLFEELKGMPPPQPKGAPPAGKPGDSPQDLAVRANDTQAKLQIAQSTNAVKEQQIASNERIKDKELALDAMQHHETMAANINKEADQRVFRDVRTNALESREAGRLQ
jgi:hypothetical protein